MQRLSSLDRTFRALADGTRRSMIHALARGEHRSAGELGRQFRSAQPTISKHLKILERAGLITVGQDAQRRRRRFEGKPLAEASAWLERYRASWEANFERLDGVLEELQRRTSASTRARGQTKR